MMKIAGYEVQFVGQSHFAQNAAENAGVQNGPMELYKNRFLFKAPCGPLVIRRDVKGVVLNRETAEVYAGRALVSFVAFRVFSRIF